MEEAINASGLTFRLNVPDEPVYILMEDKMNNKKIWGLGSVIVLLIVCLLMLTRSNTITPVGVFTQNKEANITVLATADLHGDIPDKLAEYIQDEKKKDENLILVDAGDFYDMQNSQEMRQWSTIYNLNPEHPRRMPPIVHKMDEMGYDAVVLGNHEFVANDMTSLNELVLDFNDCSIPVLSANLYTTKSAYPHHYVNPYIIKEIETEQGIVKVGILGLTIKEVGESDGPQELKDLPQYGGSLELTDIVKEANEKMWVECMKYNGADIIIAVVHSGEEPLKPKNPGNRIKKLARSVNGIDAIVAAHTHVNIPQHKYQNPSGNTVIVTQPGKWGEYCSKINFTLIKENGKWKLKDKSSLTQKI